MKISKFKKTSNGKYKIYLDNNETVVLYEDVIINNNLLIKKDIDTGLLEKLIIENNNVNVYSTAINYISIRMRSEKEVYDYLEKKQIDNQLIKDTINKLSKLGYINDYLFAKSYVNDKINLSNDGPLKIKKSLMALGVEENIIEQILNSMDKEEMNIKLEKLIGKKLKTTKGSLNMVKLKIINYFYNLGYDKKDILSILENIEIDTNITELEKEYSKLYNKYSKKYDSSKLKAFIEQKLYAKGYTREDISKIKRES